MFLWNKHFWNVNFENTANNFVKINLYFLCLRVNYLTSRFESQMTILSWIHSDAHSSWVVDGVYFLDTLRVILLCLHRMSMKTVFDLILIYNTHINKNRFYHFFMKYLEILKTPREMDENPWWTIIYSLCFLSISRNTRNIFEFAFLR